MSEIEHVYEGEVVEPDTEEYDWEMGISEWAEGGRYELYGQLRRAKAAARIGRRYGWASMTQFAKEVGCSKSKVYDYAKVWTVFGHIFEDESSELSGRLETLGISHLIRSLAAPEPVKMAIEAQDEGLTVRQIEERVRGGEPQNVETITELICPSCGEVFPINAVETRERAM